MVQECVTLLQAAGGTDQKIFVDATFGAGGHSAALLDAVPGSKVFAIDADPASIERAELLSRRYPGRLRAAHGNFGDVAALLDAAGIGNIDGIVYDLGISSLQLGGEQRGFSFARNEPLDMRLDPSAGSPSASDLLASATQTQLETMLRTYGNERNARAIARAIVRRRPRVEVWMTNDLLAAVWSALPKRAARTHQRIHPATRTFQALRIAVNSDLENIEHSLRAAVKRLKPRGRIVAISFHSGEDRVVKQEFKAFEHAGIARTLTRKPLRPTDDEVEANVRSRSAKLRATEQSDAATLQVGTEVSWH